MPVEGRRKKRHWEEGEVELQCHLNSGFINPTESSGAPSFRSGYFRTPEAQKGRDRGSLRHFTILSSCCSIGKPRLRRARRCPKSPQSLTVLSFHK